MPLSPGQVLQQRYRIVTLLGQGGFGAVYKAWDVNLNHPCALKENLDTSPMAQRQFQREATVLANLSHPNLPRVIDHFFIAGQGQYLVMDYIEGDDLQTLLEREGAQPEERVIDWMAQICDALNFLHSQNPPIIHRDIKPANIKITPQGKAVLVDFGIVKIWDASQRTTQGARAITPGYSPFEQYGNAPTDPRTDIYALGATTYAMLTGREPVDAIARVARTALPAPRSIKPSISSRLEQAILKATEIQPDDRYKTIEQFKTALLHKAAAAPVHPLRKPAVTAPAQAAVRLPKSTRVRKRFPVGIIAGALGGAVLIALVIIGFALSPQLFPPTAAVTMAAPTASVTTPTTEPFNSMLVSNTVCGEGDVIKELASLDRETVKITLCHPDPAFLAKLAMPLFGIQPREWVESAAISGEIFQHPVGTGPFQFVEWNRGSSIILVPFDDYRGAQPLSPGVILTFEDDPARRIEDIAAGNTDFITNVSPADYYETLIAHPDLTLLTVPQPNLGFLGMNTSVPPLDDLRVRQAIAMSLDRQYLVDNFYPPGTVVADYLTPCIIPGGCSGEPWYATDVVMAKNLAAGVLSQDTIKLYYRDVYRVALPDPAGVAEEIRRQLMDNLPISVDVIALDNATFMNKLITGSLDGIFLLNWSADYFHPQNFLVDFFDYFDRAYGGIPADTAALLAEAETTTDPVNVYSQINNNLRDNTFLIPLANTSTLAVAGMGIENATMPAFLGPNLASFKINTELRYELNYEPPDLYCMDENAVEVCSQVLEGLVTYAANGEVAPALAESWEMSADGLEYTFHLTPGIKFHDGSLLDASDVVATYAAGMDTSSPYHVGDSGTYDYITMLLGLMND